MSEHATPCTRCGACCAAFRVDFHPVELAGGAFAWEGGVPVAMTVALNARLVRLRGTDASPPRCVALQGEIGQAVSCSIYAQRPGPCREFAAHGGMGGMGGNPACNSARWQHGLPPLAD